MHCNRFWSVSRLKKIYRYCICKPYTYVVYNITVTVCKIRLLFYRKVQYQRYRICMSIKQAHDLKLPPLMEALHYYLINYLDWSESTWVSYVHCGLWRLLHKSDVKEFMYSRANKISPSKQNDVGFFLHMLYPIISMCSQQKCSLSKSNICHGKYYCVNRGMLIYIDIAVIVLLYIIR